MKIEKIDYLIIICLLLISFLIRASGGTKVPMYGDEWIYWTNVNRILASNFVPRADVFSSAPPFLSYIGALVTLFFGGDLNVVRGISTVFGSLTVPALYLFGNAMYDRKTGLLSALFLCFSAYHILYSRILMQEALSLFFITAFLYFFWMSQNSSGRKSTTYAIVAGAMLGLAIDAKWMSLFLVPAALTYVLWTGKFKLRALSDKRLVLIFIFALLLFLPLLISLFYTGVDFSGMTYSIYEKFSKKSPISQRVSSNSIYELFEKAMDNISGILMYGSDFLISPWITKVSFVLFIIIFLSFFRNFLNLEKKGSFLIINFFYLAVIVLSSSANKHYLLYMFPFYFVMLSHVFLNSFKDMNILKIVIILLTSIMLFSSVITSVTSYNWDKGDYQPWANDFADYIKRDIFKSGYEGSVQIATLTYLKEPVDRALYLSSINATTIEAFKAADKYSSEAMEVDYEKISSLKPVYLVVPEPQYEYYVKGNFKLLKDYGVVSNIQTYPFGCFVLKRKNIQPQGSSTDGIGANISQDILKLSVPSVMKIGKTYTASIQVKNTGDFRTNFTVNLYSDVYTIFLNEWQRKVTLDKGSIITLKIKIVPFKGYAGKLTITADLYANDEENGTYKKVDSSTDYIYLIERPIFDIMN
ncbi:MAG: glycosyltransferase family 39 protein [Candidatus Methanoperedens sp.]|nr:glycosyltransferase family 39 protein [Candidatus Methanoperedens sp.]MCZ7371828.1 glycosyltransferase family 39 protein [Candidatus Methanoperedens sp.]